MKLEMGAFTNVLQGFALLGLCASSSAVMAISKTFDDVELIALYKKGGSTTHARLFAPTLAAMAESVATGQVQERPELVVDMAEI